MDSARDTARVAPGRWVAPFGDPGITDRSHLPRAFRSVLRPSSPLSAKASTRCPSLLLPPASHTRRPCQGSGTRIREPARRAPPIRDPRPGIHEDTSDTPRALRPQAYPPRSHHFSLFTFSINTPPAATPPANSSLRRARTAIATTVLIPDPCLFCEVEVIGLEPTTSCLQSRRSPS